MNWLEPIGTDLEHSTLHTKPLFSAVTENNAKLVASHGCYAMHQFEWNLPTVHLFLAFQTTVFLSGAVLSKNGQILGWRAA